VAESAVLRRLAPYAANFLIRTVRRTMRLRHAGIETVTRLQGENRRFIVAFWHGRLFLMRYAYPGRRISILISRHADGELIARTMELFGLHASRGSTSEGGAAGLREIVRRVREGYDLAFTPDGPRGPRQVAQMGVIQAARLARIPIVPVAFGASRARRLASWDRFLVPLPFSRGLFVYGDPIEVPREADETLMEEARLRVERALNELTERADREA
jgi:lysophospholipid acyltransferase (LPLAT)-like uncharacterized protein